MDIVVGEEAIQSSTVHQEIVAVQDAETKRAAGHWRSCNLQLLGRELQCSGWADSMVSPSGSLRVDVGVRENWYWYRE